VNDAEDDGLAAHVALVGSGACGRIRGSAGGGGGGGAQRISREHAPRAHEPSASHGP